MRIKSTLAIALAFLWISPFLSAQTTEELTVIKEAKAAELTALETELSILSGRVDSLKTEVADLEEILRPYPRWDLGATGNFGFNVSQYSDWLSKSEPNTNALSLGFTVNANAHLDQPKYFWRNNLALALGWQKFDNEDDPLDDNDLKVATDGLNINSLYGYKITKTIALSALADYRTSMLEGKLNNPGYLDLGVGGTWTPSPNLVVTVHPLSYNFVFSNDVFDYQSSAGLKALVEYT